VYNELNKQTARILPDGRIETKVYDANGLLIKATDFNEHVTGFSYDDVNAPGRLHNREFFDSNSLYDSDDPNVTYHYRYDNLGRKTYVDVNDQGDEVAYHYYYNQEGQIYQLDSPQGYIRYGFYDNTGRKASVFTPTAPTDDDETYYDKTEYGYDELGRLEWAQLSEANDVPRTDEITYYSYSSVGSLEQVAYPNNTTTYTYDNLNRLTDVNIYDNSGLFASYAYELAADGTRTAVAESVWNGVDYNDTIVNW
ncbi:unnamed protein product, partial [marine sediment metagenome]